MHYIETPLFAKCYISILRGKWMAFVIQGIWYIYRMKRKVLLVVFIFLGVFSSKINAQYRLYGVTTLGGIYNDGVIFYYDPLINKDSVVFSFNGTNGSEPATTLFLASDGLLYGLTHAGGSHGLGVIYSFNPKTNIEQILVNSDAITGYDDDGGNNIIQLNDTMLYGTFSYGGSHKAGTLYSINMKTNNFTLLANLDSLTNGAFPVRNLSYDTTNHLIYGITQFGGLYNLGTIFSFNVNNDKDSVIYNFNTFASEPITGLTRALNGLYYGMTPGGGDSGVGLIYSFNSSNGQVDTLVNFNRLNGSSPWGNNFYLASNGLLYAMITEGGSSQLGVLCSYDPVIDEENVLVNFNNTTGFFSFGDVIQDPDNGLLYGMTQEGGTHSDGTFFSYDINSSTFTKIFDFNGTNGAMSKVGLTLVYDTLISTGESKINANGVSIYPNPSTGIFTLSFLGARNLAPATIEIYNVFGEEVFYSNYPRYINHYSLDISNHPNGVYLYRVINADGTSLGSGKLIIQK